MQIKLGSKGAAGNFDFEAMRCLGVASMGGAGVGECLAAIAQIRRGDIESFAAAVLRTLYGRLSAASSPDPVAQAHYRFLAMQIKTLLDI